MVFHYNIHIYGRVQGVGFRYAARTVALQYELTGFVRNMVNGSVYIEIEGSSQDCMAFIDWCRIGPGYGRVDDVEVNESNISGFEDFVIKR